MMDVVEDDRFEPFMDYMTIASHMTYTGGFVYLCTPYTAS